MAQAVALEKKAGSALHKNWNPVTIGKAITWTRFHEGSDRKLPTVVLTHGIVTSGPQLDPLFDALTRSYRGSIVAVELPGHGISDRLGTRTRLLDYATEIIRIAEKASGLAKLDLTRTVFVGHCHSADIVHKLAQTTEVAGTVMLNPISTLSLPKMLLRDMKLWYRLFVKPFLRKIREKIGDAKEHLAAVKDATDPTKYNSRLLLALRSVIDAAITWRDRSYGTQENYSPTLIVTGEHDVKATPKVVRKLSKTIGNSDVMVLPDVGHMTILVKPEEVAREIVWFVERRISTVLPAVSTQNP